VNFSPKAGRASGGGAKRAFEGSEARPHLDVALLAFDAEVAAASRESHAGFKALKRPSAGFGHEGSGRVRLGDPGPVWGLAIRVRRERERAY
jgi:hypothetical protein